MITVKEAYQLGYLDRMDSLPGRFTRGRTWGVQSLDESYDEGASAAEEAYFGQELVAVLRALVMDAEAMECPKEGRYFYGGFSEAKITYTKDGQFGFIEWPNLAIDVQHLKELLPCVKEEPYGQQRG